MVIPGKERNGIYIENFDHQLDLATLSRLVEQILVYFRPDPTVLFHKEGLKTTGNHHHKEQCRILQEHMTKEKAYQDRSLSLAGLAKEVGMPQRAITDAINICLGQNFSAFVNSYRIEAVKQALSDTACKDKTILEIALAQGFNSKSTFNDVFKESVGTTPSKFRAGLTAGWPSRG